MANKVEICGVDTAKLPLYKEAEMTEMLHRIKAGDEATRDKFIKGNLSALPTGVKIPTIFFRLDASDSSKRWITLI